MTKLKNAQRMCGSFERDAAQKGPAPWIALFMALVLPPWLHKETVVKCTFDWELQTNGTGNFVREIRTKRFFCHLSN